MGSVTRRRSRQQSHEARVAAVFEASYRRLVAQLVGVAADRAEAEEAVQEAFARAVGAHRFPARDNVDRFDLPTENQVSAS